MDILPKLSFTLSFLCLPWKNKESHAKITRSVTCTEACWKFTVTKDLMWSQCVTHFRHGDNSACDNSRSHRSRPYTTLNPRDKDRWLKKYCFIIDNLLDIHHHYCTSCICCFYVGLNKRHYIGNILRMCVCTVCWFEVRTHMSVINMSIIRVYKLILFCLCGFYKTKNPAVSSSTQPSNKQP